MIEANGMTGNSGTTTETTRTAAPYVAHPLRVQRKRTAGYRMPEDVVYVGRPTRWGNPYRPEEFVNAERGAVECFRVLVESEQETIADIQRELRGKRLACWCSLDNPCHADVLAEIANRADNGKLDALDAENKLLKELLRYAAPSVDHSTCLEPPYAECKRCEIEKATEGRRISPSD